MEFKELIRTRRSVRGYAAGSVPHDDLIAILDDARMAPSWKNSQTYRAYVVESPEEIPAFGEAVLPSFNRKNTVHAAYIVTTFVKDIAGFNDGVPVDSCGNFWGAYDLGLHDAYLILAASEHGYDTLIMGLRDAALIREKLGIPENEEIMSVIAIGKRAAESPLRPRKALSEQVKFF